jgi:hypothetical protein
MRKILIASVGGLLFLAACGQDRIVAPNEIEDPPEEMPDGGLVATAATSIAITGTGLIWDRSI